MIAVSQRQCVGRALIDDELRAADCMRSPLTSERQGCAGVAVAMDDHRRNADLGEIATIIGSARLLAKAKAIGTGTLSIIVLIQAQVSRSVSGVKNGGASQCASLAASASVDFEIWHA